MNCELHPFKPMCICWLGVIVMYKTHKSVNLISKTVTLLFMENGWDHHSYKMLKTEGAGRHYTKQSTMWIKYTLIQKYIQAKCKQQEHKK